MFERFEAMKKRLTQFVPENEMPYQDDVIEAFAKHFKSGRCTYMGGETWGSTAFNGVNMFIDIETLDSWDDVIERAKDVHIDNVTIIEASCYAKVLDKSIYRVYLNYSYETPFDAQIERVMAPCA